MWAIVTWVSPDASDSIVVTNDEGYSMVFASCGEAVEFANRELNQFFHPVLLESWDKPSRLI